MAFFAIFLGIGILLTSVNASPVYSNLSYSAGSTSPSSLLHSHEDYNPGLAHPFIQVQSSDPYEDSIDFDSLHQFLLDKGLHGLDDKVGTSSSEAASIGVDHLSKKGQETLTESRPLSPSPLLHHLNVPLPSSPPKTFSHARSPPSSPPQKTSQGKIIKKSSKPFNYDKYEKPYYKSLSQNQQLNIVKRYRTLSGRAHDTCRHRLRTKCTQERFEDLFSEDSTRQAKAMHELALAKEGDILNSDEKVDIHKKLRKYWQSDSSNNTYRRLRKGLFANPHLAVLLRSGNQQDFATAAEILGPQNIYPKTRAPKGSFIKKAREKEKFVEFKLMK